MLMPRVIGIACDSSVGLDSLGFSLNWVGDDHNALGFSMKKQQ